MDGNQGNWNAFRYVAGELTGGELEAFEELLAGDQSVRDAVVDAARLSEAVASAESGLLLPVAEICPPVRRVGSNPAVSASAVVALAAAVLVAVLFVYRDAGQRDVASRRSTPLTAVDERSDMLAVWTELISLAETGEVSETQNARGLDADDIAVSSAESELEFDVPEWMIAALAPNAAEDSDDLWLEN